MGDIVEKDSSKRAIENYEAVAIVNKKRLYKHLSKLAKNRKTDSVKQKRKITTFSNNPYCKDQNIKSLQNLYHQEDDFLGEAICHVTESCLASITEEQLKLTKYQQDLEDKFNQPYLNCSLHQTMYMLLLDRRYKLADELKKEFKVTDRKYITSLAETGDWLELDKFSKSKKSSIGYEPFVDICLKYENKYEAQKYLTRVKEENKIKYCLKAGVVKNADHGWEKSNESGPIGPIMDPPTRLEEIPYSPALEEACKVAFEQKDEAALNHIQSKCGAANRMLAEKIAVMKAQLARNTKHEKKNCPFKYYVWESIV
ncbi:Vacuolar protein sorting-associated protein 16 [Nymphon striatum]|nr:Vacuolar protein sorting-associated protein 16 [Nymphon striatum]